jgi:TldD protein
MTREHPRVPTRPDRHLPSRDCKGAVRKIAVSATALATAILIPALLLSQDDTLPKVPADDAVLRAMHDELIRSRQLAGAGGTEKPYYFNYGLGDTEDLHVTASLGAAVNISHNHFRVPEFEVRVGSYDFDNTGHIFSGYYTGSRFDRDWPLDDNYANMREALWLSTDLAYKAALESMSRKRASLNSAAAQTEPIPDFSKTTPVVRIDKVVRKKLEDDVWSARAARISSVFNTYPEILASAVEVQLIQGTTYMVDSEGSVERYSDSINWIYGKAEGQAPDGMAVHDAASLQAIDLDKLHSEADLRKDFTAVADNVRALQKAPAETAYTGPVLFEPLAGAQLLAALIGDNLRIPRKPVTDPGRNVNYLPSEFETRINAKVLPEWFDVTDDPTQTNWNGKPLAGYYPFDLEGVAPKPVSVIEKGMLKSILTTRQPVKGFPVSNGHARLPGNYGAHSAAIGNMFVKTSQSTPLAQLKQKLLDMVKDRGRPYGMLVRKLDYPYSGSTAQLQSLAQAARQAGGSPMPVAPPLLIYRVYPDGHEELVRGLQFRGVSTRTLRDIQAASAETVLFEYVNNAAPLAMLGGGGYLAGTSVVAPGLLFDELELEAPRDQLPKPAIVPPPQH